MGQTEHLPPLIKAIMMNTVTYGMDFLLGVYTEMWTIRLFELATLSNRAGPKTVRLIPGYLHPSIGQEAIAVGACRALSPEDKIVSTHRGIGHLLAKGADPRRLMAELAGKSTGYAGGRGGPLHVTDLDKGILGTQGIVAAGLPVAVGSALSSKSTRGNWVTLAFLGDGAVDQGVFHESMNLASLWHVPVVFLCENNKYSEGMNVTQHLAVKDMVSFVASYGIAATKTDGNDVLEVYEAVRSAVTLARTDSKPAFVEADTYRVGGHYHGDKQEYQDQLEIEYWKSRDPLSLLAAALSGDGRFTDKAMRECEETATCTVQDAISFAQSSPVPQFAELMRLGYV